MENNENLLLPKGSWQLRINAEKNYLKKLEKLAAELSNEKNINKATDLTKARWDVELFELYNKIATTRQYLKNLDYHYTNIFLPNYEEELQVCEAQWGAFSLAIEQFKDDETVKRLFDEFAEGLENIEVKNKLFKALKHKVNM